MPFLYYSRIVRLDELGQTFVVLLFMRHESVLCRSASWDCSTERNTSAARHVQNSRQEGGGGGLMVRSIFGKLYQKLKAVLSGPPHSHFCHKRLRRRLWLFTIYKKFPKNPVGKLMEHDVLDLGF